MTHISDDDIDFIFEELGICSCGDTDDQVMFIKNYLTLMSDFKYMNPAVIELIKDNPETVYEILGHFLANVDIVEYGSSIRGCWLTGKGEQLLKRIGEIDGQ